MEALIKSIDRTPANWDELKDVPDGQKVCVIFEPTEHRPEPVQSTQPIHIPGTALRTGKQYVVRVKKWMTEDHMDFNGNWNNGRGMPFRVMAGRVLKETRGMVYMELKARRLKTDYCMRCGKALTHPVSRLYGLGPECGGHYHINPFETEEELRAAVKELDETLNAIQWSGWIAKSGIEYASEIGGGSYVPYRNPSRDGTL